MSMTKDDLAEFLRQLADQIEKNGIVENDKDSCIKTAYELIKVDEGIHVGYRYGQKMLIKLKFKWDNILPFGENPNDMFVTDNPWRDE